MTRIDGLKDRCTNHYFYSRSAKKLTEAEFDRMVQFIEDRTHLNFGEFALAAHRALLSGSLSSNQKNAIRMEELIHVANEVALGSQRRA